MTYHDGQILVLLHTRNFDLAIINAWRCFSVIMPTPP